ncbi:calpain [Holotrichia oblita]|uniref:Calpain n=1 Tax=Holotrichia oblita TaxID=644536 RepID=A0ACB9TSX2_HOLOL|nr:calpain [Holotrichia oblita]
MLPQPKYVKNIQPTPQQEQEKDQVYQFFMKLAGEDGEVDWMELKEILDYAMRMDAPIYRMDAKDVEAAGYQGYPAYPQQQQQQQTSGDNSCCTQLLLIGGAALCCYLCMQLCGNKENNQSQTSTAASTLAPLATGCLANLCPSGNTMNQPSNTSAHYSGVDNQIITSPPPHAPANHYETRNKGFSNDVCRSMVAMLDADHSGKLGFEEFKSLWSDIRDWKNVFRLYDKDNSGTLDGFELRQALNSAGYHLNNHILNILMHRYGNKQAQLEFDDFIMCAVKLKSMIRELSGYRSGALQNFYKLRDKHLKENTLFEDDLFPANDTSICYTPNIYGEVVWKRPKELCDNPKLLVDGHSRKDAIQGHQLGDCWVIAAISNLASYEEVLHFVMPSDQDFDDKYAGIFHFRFWQYGKWVDVVVDDRLPYSVEYSNLFSIRSNEANEFWAPLLEKAYAKLHGSYEALNRGYCSDAMQDFTGGITEIFRIDEIDTANLHELLRTSYEAGAMLSCSLRHKLAKGIQGQHAYGITSMQYVQKQGSSEKIPLIRLRNPWGVREWKGDWGDRSGLWNSVSEEDKKALGYVKIDEGEFWMAYSDFERNCVRIEICHRSPLPVIANQISNSQRDWKVSFFEGRWIKNCSAGGRLCLQCAEHDEDVAYDQYNISKQVIDVCSANEADETDQVTQLFWKLSGDGGTINWFKLKIILQSVLCSEKRDIKFSNEVCKSLLAMLDVDQSGELSLSELQALWKDVQHWKSVFQLYDEDKSGALSSFELRNALNSVGFSVNTKVLNLLMQRFRNEKGELILEDFIAAAVKLKTMINIFKEESDTNTGKATFTLDRWLQFTLYN